jgi:uncharacterized protein YaeQ
MSFVDGFYSYQLDIMDSDRGVYAAVRVKTPKHPNETCEHLIARVLALAHRYEEGLCFGQGLFEPGEPTLWRRDITGETQTWVQVGVPEERKLERALRAHPLAAYTVYFFEEWQKVNFCGRLRGSKTNWIKPVVFYEIGNDAVAALAVEVQSKSHWEITISDSTAYVSAAGRSIVVPVVPLDMWQLYQKTIQNGHESGKSAGNF